MLIADVRTNLFTDFRDGQRIEPAHFAQHTLRHSAAHLNSACTTLLQRRIVKKRVGIRIQNLMRELRRRRRVHGEASDASAANACQHRDQACEVHRLTQDILHHFANQRMIRNLNIALNILETGCRLRKYAREQIIGTRTLNLRRNLLSLLKP